jgi:pilus assembly protein Flp/PilA
VPRTLPLACIGTESCDSRDPDHPRPDQSTATREENQMINPFIALQMLSLTVGDRLKALKDDQRGASAVEYALLVGLIAVAVYGAVTLFGGKLSTLFSGINVNGH